MRITVLNVRPSDATHYFSYSVGKAIQQSPELVHRKPPGSVNLSNFQDLGVRKSGSPVPLSLVAPTTAFGHHVRTVFGGRSQKEVRWIAARLIVAFVTDEHAFRNRSMRELPCEAMTGSRNVINCHASIS